MKNWSKSNLPAMAAAAAMAPPAQKQNKFKGLNDHNIIRRQKTIWKKQKNGGIYRWPLLPLWIMNTCLPLLLFFSICHLILISLLFFSSALLFSSLLQKNIGASLKLFINNFLKSLPWCIWCIWCIDISCIKPVLPKLKNRYKTCLNLCVFWLKPFLTKLKAQTKRGNGENMERGGKKVPYLNLSFWIFWSFFKEELHKVHNKDTTIVCIHLLRNLMEKSRNII